MNVVNGDPDTRNTIGSPGLGVTPYVIAEVKAIWCIWGCLRVRSSAISYGL